METAAKAYLSLIPKLDKTAQSTITSELSTAAKAAGTSAGNDGGASLGGMVASSFATIMKTAGVIAIGKAITDTLTTAFTEYADYEQLVGGAELMFGSAYDYIAERAKNAYSEVQLSQNDYLQQVNGFATGLTTSLGGNEQAAAELADKIVTAEADIVAATGNSQEAVQNAFNGIMKSNYTMLDNLQIGITPTKAGMQEVIDKVNEWHASQGDLTTYTMDSLADQQSALVDYVEMVGLAGYAHEESSKTIQGSIASLKAAWSNWMVGLAGGTADMQELTQSVFESIETVAGNVLPVVSRIAQTILDNLPIWVTSIVQYIVDNAPAMLQAGIHFFLQLVGSIGQSLPDIIAGLFRLIQDMIAYILSPQFLADLAYAGAMLIQGLVGGIGKGIAEFILNIPNMFGQMIDGVMDFFGIHSPSTVFAGIGGYMMDGLALGIEKNANEPQKAMASAMGELANVTTSAAELNVSASTQASAVGIGGITIQNLTVHAEDVLTADKFVSMVRQAAAAY